jgi:hypothetical protein
MSKKCIYIFILGFAYEVSELEIRFLHPTFARFGRVRLTLPSIEAVFHFASTTKMSEVESDKSAGDEQKIKIYLCLMKAAKTKEKKIV